MQIGAGDEKCGHEAYGAACEDGECKSESENGVVDLNAVDLRKLWRQKRGENVHAVVGEGDSREAADDAENERLTEKLTHETRTAGAQRGADSDFSRARSGPGEQKIGDIGARDEQYETDGTEQNEQGRFHLADEKIAQRDHADGPTVVVFGILFCETVGDRVELSVRLIESDARLDATSQSKPMASATLEPTPEKRIINDRNPYLAALLHLRKAEVGRHDADDGERALVERDGGAGDVGVGTERAAPKVFAEDDDGSGAGFSVVGHKGTPENRLNLKCREEVGCDDGCVDDEWIAVARERELMRLNAGQTDKDVGLFAKIAHVGKRRA